MCLRVPCPTSTIFGAVSCRYPYYKLQAEKTTKKPRRSTQWALKGRLNHSFKSFHIKQKTEMASKKKHNFQDVYLHFWKNWISEAKLPFKKCSIQKKSDSILEKNTTLVFFLETDSQNLQICYTACSDFGNQAPFIYFFFLRQRRMLTILI